MTQEIKPGQLLSLRAWLYGIPIVFMTYPIYLFLTSREEIAFCRFLAAPSIVAILAYMLWRNRKIEKEEGPAALPDLGVLTKFGLLLVMFAFCVFISIKVNRPQGSIGVFGLVAGAPNSLIFLSQKKVEASIKSDGSSIA